MHMNSSEITVNARGQVTGYFGPDAVHFARVRMLRSSIKLWKQTGLIPTRGVGIKRMLAMASEYTGKPYHTRNIEAALTDLDTWLATMAAALPVRQD